MAHLELIKLQQASLVLVVFEEQRLNVRRVHLEPQRLECLAQLLVIQLPSRCQGERAEVNEDAIGDSDDATEMQEKPTLPEWFRSNLTIIARSSSTIFVFVAFAVFAVDQFPGGATALDADAVN